MGFRQEKVAESPVGWFFTQGTPCKLPRLPPNAIIKSLIEPY